MADTTIRSEDEAPKGKMANLPTLWSFVRPYKGHLLAASFFLIIAAATVLIVPSALQGIIDQGFSAEDLSSIDYYFLMFLSIVLVMAVATALRFYFITWLGERVVADIMEPIMIWTSYPQITNECSWPA